jgi:hypothetical protein
MPALRLLIVIIIENSFEEKTMFTKIQKFVGAKIDMRIIILVVMIALFVIGAGAPGATGV